jgi:hypothetical protein
MSWIRPHVVVGSCAMSVPRTHVAAPNRASSSAFMLTRRACRVAARRRTVSLFISRFQTAHLVPAARFCVRALPLCFAHPPLRGGRSAERRSGVCETPVGHAMTRRVRRLARRLASHDAGRSPLGAPPWRFWAPGPRFSVTGTCLRWRFGGHPDPSQRAPRSQVIVPDGRGPGPPGASGYKPPPRDATPRSAFRMSPETPLKERGCESCTLNAIRSQVQNVVIELRG